MVPCGRTLKIFQFTLTRIRQTNINNDPTEKKRRMILEKKMFKVKYVDKLVGQRGSRAPGAESLKRLGGLFHFSQHVVTAPSIAHANCARGWDAERNIIFNKP